MGNIEMIGKSQAEMFRGEKLLETKFAPTGRSRDVAEHAVDFWLSTEDLPPPVNRVTLDMDGEHHLATRRATRRVDGDAFQQLQSMLDSLRMHPEHLLPRFAYMETHIPVAGARTRRYGPVGYDPVTRS